jgi:hypothetical protein
MVVTDWMGEKRGESRWRIEVRKPIMREPKLKQQMRDIVVTVG